MRLKEIIHKLELVVKTKSEISDRQVNRGYASDLLSDVLANSKEGDLWITLQVHPNIIAVAGIKGLSGIVIINARAPEEATILKAEEENIPIMVSKWPAFELIGRLYNLGISGLENAVKRI